MDDDLCLQFSEQIHLLLTNAVSKCFTSSVGSLGVLFSGGLDSSLIAAILSKAYAGHIQLFVAGLESAKDLELAHEAAEALNLSLTLRVFTQEDVKEALPTISSLLGIPDVMHTELSIPFFFAAQCADQFDITTLFCGQGADELFGGYAKYEKLFLQTTPKVVLKLMDSDLDNLQNETLPLLQRIVSHFGVHLEIPFLDPPLIEFSDSIPISCKLHESDDGIIRKQVLRLLAKNLGLPPQVVNAPKRAMQYGSGANRVLTKLAIDYWINQNPELSQRQAKTHARIEQYLKQLIMENPDS